MTTATTPAPATTWVCKDCGTPLVTKKRTAGPPPGFAVHAADGRCPRCYLLARNAARLQYIADHADTAITGTCDCYACDRAGADYESPRALIGGKWVLNPRTRVREWRRT